MTDTKVTAVDLGPRRVARRVVVDAPAAELFALVADPRRHGELDGSGTVKSTVSGPDRLGPGDRFTVAMRMYGAPYRITSTVTEFTEGRVIEWRHPFGHRWRWEFDEQSPGRTQVTEVWDYTTAKVPKVFELAGFPKKDAHGITDTLLGLARRYGG
ncbi:SRPBCC family protein [Speluncibacter jeojiensis]|uniref:SRPBCC family protein n=1 Tax=Speluncibacter jeojiensis TaxID=2710754 RepID=A0A9X4M1P0_9ACTN|nr:SRPBCC family protein [Corynebacteriales bacterium D3-21]